MAAMVAQSELFIAEPLATLHFERRARSRGYRAVAGVGIIRVTEIDRIIIL
jgi:hypothetical protein